MGDDIDPTVFIDDDGMPWLVWGNPSCYMVRINPNMTELDGSIQRIHLPNYIGGPWLNKKGGLYYLTYASFAHQGFSEKICYATAPQITGPWTYRGILTGNAKNSYTIHPAIIEFKGQSYLFYHNAALTLPYGQKGATGRRAVCLEYLYYNPDGTIQPVIQTREEVSLPPTQIRYARQGLKSAAVSDKGVFVKQNTAPGATRWAGNPIVATIPNLDSLAILPTGFNRDSGATSIGQTFTMDKDIKLGRICFYAGDGLGTDENNPIRIALYDLGPEDSVASASSYTTGANLLGSGKGLSIGYRVQAPGLIQFDFKGPNQVMFKAGHKYVFELHGTRNSASIFWRRSKSDVYSSGAAYCNRHLIEERNKQTSDFAIAVYGVR